MPDLNWGSVADWVSGIGSLAAAVVALYVARSSQRIILQGYCGCRVIIGQFQSPIDVFAVSATNISQRPTTITNIGITFGLWRWKKYGIITFMQDQFGHGIPKPLSDGETGYWSVPLGDNDKWLVELISEFKLTTLSVYTLRIEIHTSNGGITTLKPDKNTRKKLMGLIKG